MDPVTAFSLAGTVLQFIDTGTRFIVLATRLYHSSSEDSSTNADIGKVTIALDRLLPQLETSAETDDDERDMRELAKDCGKTAKELLEMLERVKLPENSRKRDALKIAFRQMCTKDEIKVLRERLQMFRSQLSLQLVYSLRKHAAKSHAERLEDVKRLRAIHEEVGTMDEMKVEMRKIGGLAESILRYLTERRLGPGDHTEEARMLQQELAETLKSEGSNVSVGNPPSASIDMSLEQRQSAESIFLASLRYSEMADRELRISHAHESTFQWVLTDRDRDEEIPKRRYTNLKSWFESTDQLYWITGKAGSGKSTLVKYLCSPLRQTEIFGDVSSTTKESRCLPLLRSWASPHQPIIASFYFWNSGAQIQMSQEGLLRALLHQLLSRRPDIIPDLAPLDWESIYLFNREPRERTLDDLQELLLRAVRTLLKDAKICFFIDGLDEFEGSQDDLIDTVRQLMQCGDDVKVLTASRPWTVFEDAFGQGANLKLQDLTHDDIMNFVHDRFNADAEFEKLRKRKPTFANKLMEDIVDKASGVFLWVDLVTSSLLAGMRYGDRIEDFQRRLDELPSDLERLYEKILWSLDEFYLDHAAQYFSLVETAIEPLNLLEFSFADEESVESAISMPIGRLSDDDISQRVEDVRKRLNSRCKGLLEVGGGLQRIEGEDWQRTSCLRIQYLHRTVRDFIKSPNSQSYLKSKRSQHFDPNLQLCLAYLMIMKNWSGQTELDPKLDNDSTSTIGTVFSCLNRASGALKANAGEVVRLLDDLDRLRSLPAYKRHFMDTQAALDKLTSSDQAFSEILSDFFPVTVLRPRRKLGRSFQNMWVAENLENPRPVGGALCINSPDPHDWIVERITHPSIDGSLLSLACHFGVEAYVRARAQWGGCITKDSPGASDRWPLMLDVLSCRIVRPEMVQCLLDMGTDPNFKVGGLDSQSLWMIALKKALHVQAHDGLASPFSKSSLNEWKKVVRLFFTHGATITKSQDLLLSPQARIFLREIQTAESRLSMTEAGPRTNATNWMTRVWPFSSM